MTVNKAILIGNLGQDPELRTTANGTAITKLRIATNERRRDRDGNWSDHTEWHRVVVFGRQAENVAQYLSKGRQIYVEGRIQTQKWQDRNGQDRWTTEIIADNIRFLGGGGSQVRRPAMDHDGGSYNQGPQPSGRPSQPRPAPPVSPAAVDPEGPPPFDDDVPF